MHFFSQLRKQKGRIEISLAIFFIGQDILAHLSGGDSHLGAMALAAPGQIVNSCTLPGHKETEIASSVASLLADGLNARVAVVAGIHYDGASREEICMAVSLSRELALEALQLLRRRANRDNDRSTECVRGISEIPAG